MKKRLLSTSEMRHGEARVVLCKDELELGRQAAFDVAEKIRELLDKEKEIKIVFAAAESQITFLDALALEEGIDWQRVLCFNMDDFYEVNMPQEFTCGYQTKRQLYDKVRPKQAHVIRFNAPNPDEEARRFERLIREGRGVDILCQGIGMSGHLALNEPFDTNFNDKAWVRVVDLAEQSKIQLRTDPNFKALGYIPAKGITLTIPALLSAKNIFTMVPLALKRPILEQFFALNSPTVELPASILSQVDNTLYIDRNSCPEAMLTKFN